MDRQSQARRANPPGERLGEADREQKRKEGDEERIGDQAEQR
jgi:hypothetical protein